MITSIPPELIRQILDDAAYSTTFIEPDCKTLAQCSLIHPSWTAMAQSALYTHITLSRSGRFIKHALNLSPPDCVRLLRHTRTLDITVAPAEGVDPHEKHRFNGGQLLDMLIRCPNVTTLNLSIHGFFSLNPDVSESLRQMAGSDLLWIQHLGFLECPVGSPIVFELISILPNIISLSIATELVATPPKVLPSTRLRRLVLGRSLPSDSIIWLLSSSVGCLEVLELRDPVSPWMSYIFSDHGPYIHTLRLVNYNVHAAPIVQSCTNLVKLVLLNIPMLVPMPILPPSLRNLAFMNLAFAASSPLLPVVVAVKQATGLQSLRCPRNTRNHPDFLLLEQVCKEKDIELLSHFPGHWRLVVCMVHGIIY